MQHHHLYKADDQRLLVHSHFVVHLAASVGAVDNNAVWRCGRTTTICLRVDQLAVFATLETQNIFIFLVNVGTYTRQYHYYIMFYSNKWFTVCVMSSSLVHMSLCKLMS